VQWYPEIGLVRDVGTGPLVSLTSHFKRAQRIHSSIALSRQLPFLVTPTSEPLNWRMLGSFQGVW